MSDEVDAHIENEKKTNKETKRYKDPLFYLAYIGFFWVFIFLLAVATQLWTYLESTLKYPLFVLEPRSFLSAQTASRSLCFIVIRACFCRALLKQPVAVVQPKPRLSNGRAHFT